MSTKPSSLFAAYEFHASVCGDRKVIKLTAREAQDMADDALRTALSAAQAERDEALAESARSMDLCGAATDDWNEAQAEIRRLRGALEAIAEWRPVGLDGIGTPRRLAREALAAAPVPTEPPALRDAEREMIMKAWLKTHNAHGPSMDTLLYLPEGDEPEVKRHEWIRAPWLDEVVPSGQPPNEKQRAARISRLCRMAGNIAAGLAGRRQAAANDFQPSPDPALIAKTAVDIALLIEKQVQDAVK